METKCFKTRRGSGRETGETRGGDWDRGGGEKGPRRRRKGKNMGQGDVNV